MTTDIKAGSSGFDGTEGRDLAVIEGQFTEIARVTRAPADILADGKKAAQALLGVMDAKPKDQQLVMGGERYLEFEDWSLVATFFGKAVSTPISECRFVDYGVIEVEPGKPVAVHGFEATAHLIDTRSGQKVAEASMTCLTDEPKWRSKAKYEWVDDTPEDIAGRPVDRRSTFVERDGAKKKRARIKVADEPVPLFQLRSMAQTRAGSKVCRLNYSWVAVLGGYKPTPKEEVHDAGPEPTGVPVPEADLKEISESWKALVDQKDAAKEQRDEAKKLLRALGYRGAAAKDLWADFATRGNDDLGAVKGALAPRGKAAITFADDEPLTGNGAHKPVTPATEAAAAPAATPTPPGPKKSLFPDEGEAKA